MKFELKQSDDFKYIDEGHGSVLLLLHGLFGALSNWEAVIRRFSTRYRVIIPLLPIIEMPIREASVDGLTNYTERFVEKMGLKNISILGNSLGGHIALLYALRNRINVKNLILTGSSGLFENSMGGSFPKRGDRKYIEERVKYTFYNPNLASKELVDEVFDITNNIRKGLNIVSIAKSAQRQNLAKEIKDLKVKTLLVWGLNDTITPPHVAHEFSRLMSNSEVRFIDECGHAPMMEHPEKFNEYVAEFLAEPVHA
ncbi:MAG: alpha/beta hydrolase [Bacteroidetes bacterium]|nr:MAG: alpha/beta hydrolase [Bacteroidota bacterium]